MEGCYRLLVVDCLLGSWRMLTCWEFIKFKNLRVQGQGSELNGCCDFCELWSLDTQLQLNMSRLRNIRREKNTKRNQVVTLICILFRSPIMHPPHTKMATRQQMVPRLAHFIKQSNGNRRKLTLTSPSYSLIWYHMTLHDIAKTNYILVTSWSIFIQRSLYIIRRHVIYQKKPLQINNPQP